MDYLTREKMKETYRPLIDDTDLPMDCRVHAAKQVLRAWYERNLEACGSCFKG